MVFDTEVGSKYGGQPLWHHVKCFNEERSKLLYFAGGASLPGIKTLSKEDQKMVIDAIKYVACLINFYLSNQLYPINLCNL